MSSLSILAYTDLPYSQWLFDFSAYVDDNPHLRKHSKLTVWNDYRDHQLTPEERAKYFREDPVTYNWLKQQLDKSVPNYSRQFFDINYYLNNNPDVQAWAQQFPSTVDAAWDHFRQYGQFERRMYRFDDSTIDDFVKCWPQVGVNPLKLTKEQMVKLANTMVLPVNHVHPNNMIPAGYIFLGQMIAHDITFNTTHNMDDPLSMTNQRTPQLDLDCLYSGDPDSAVYMYDKDSQGRFFLYNQEAGDLLRNPQGVAIIGDPRNDENLVVSQLQLLFLKFHNKVAEDHPDWNFTQIRSYVTKCYQSIVLHDFLKRLCGINYVENWLAQDKHILKGPWIPIEFAVAGYRFGHASLPDSLQLNQDPQSITSLFNLFTDRHSQLDWRMWFGGQGQPSKLIEPEIANSLANMPIDKPEDVPVNNLALRNLMRGQQFKLPSGQQLAQYLKLPVLSAVDLINLDLIADGMSRNTPLWYYILKEALVVKNGQQLGPLGSYIVTGVLVDLLYYDSNSILHDRSWNYPIKDMIQLIAYVTGETL